MKNQIPDIIRVELDEVPLLSPEQVKFYDTNRFIKIRQLISEETLAFFNEAITTCVGRMNKEVRPLDVRDTYGKAFLQLFNLWREDSLVRELVCSKRLAAVATQLMQTRGARIYHDQALFKEAGGGITPYHADQYYWPLANDKTITAWIPLHEVPLDMGPLEFSAGSHEILEGRDLKIGDESERVIGERLRVTDFPLVAEPFDAGEVSFHSGRVFHRAGVNRTSRMRKVMTVIYMDSEMKLKSPENANQQLDWDTWCPGARVGEVIDTPLNPVVYQR